MNTEYEDGPDPADILKHQRKMLTDEQFRRKYRALDFYEPNPRQLEFHSINPKVSEKLIRAGNQCGKSMACGAETAIHLTGLYPEKTQPYKNAEGKIVNPWPEGWTGRKFVDEEGMSASHKLRLAWLVAPNSQMLRDGSVLKLCGPIRTREEGGEDLYGTGLIPLEHLDGKPRIARGIGGGVDTFRVRRLDGSIVEVRTKSMKTEISNFQTEPVGLIHVDEQFQRGLEELIYRELLARITSTNGLIIISMTPTFGKTKLFSRMLENDPPDTDGQRAAVSMSIMDANHVTEAEKEVIRKRWEREPDFMTRFWGEPGMGEGLVFDQLGDYSNIMHNLAVEDLPPNTTRWLWAIDPTHGGGSSHFGAVLIAHDTGSKRLYVMEEVRLKDKTFAEHARAIKQASPQGKAVPVAWPQDAHQKAGGDVGSRTFMQLYKAEGLNMLGQHVLTDEGKRSELEDRIAVMKSRFQNGPSLLIARRCAKTFEELRGYHRKEGVIQHANDDLMSALSYAVVSFTKARPLYELDVYDQEGGPTRSYSRVRGKQLQAVGSEDHYYGIDD